MKIEDISVRAIGSYVPELLVSAEQAVADGIYDEEEYLANEIVGLPQEEELAPVEMSLRAARRAIDDFGVDVADLTMIVHTGTSWQGPEGWGPASYLLKHLGGREDAITFEVRHQCSGMFTALNVAASHLLASPEHTAALVVCTDNWSIPWVNRWTHLPGMPVGDASSALVLSREPGFARLLSVDHVMIPQLEELHRSGASLKAAQDADPDKTLRDASAHFMKNSEHVGNMHDLVDGANERLNARTVENAGVELSTMAYVGTINGSRQLVVGRLLPMLGIPVARSTYEIGRTLGHTGGGDQTLGFERLLRQGKFAPGDHYLMAGVGPGLTTTTAVLEVLDPPRVLTGG